MTVNTYGYMHNFIFTIDDEATDKFQVQDITPPPMSANATRHAHLGVEAKVPGTRLQLDTFDVSFLDDSSYKAWRYFYKWMKFQVLSDKPYRNCQLQCFVNDGKTGVFTMSLEDAFPINVTTPDFDTKSGATQPQLITVTFEFNNFVLVEHD